MQSGSEESDLVSGIARTLRLRLDDSIEKGHLRYYEFDIDCAEMGEYLSVDVRGPESMYRELMKELKELGGPVLYWFEILSGPSRQEIREGIINHAATSNRVVPALKKDFSEDSDCLYVGKVKRSFYGRVIQHMGYFSTPSTQGLQLYHWAREIGLVVRVHCYELHPEMVDIIAMMELELSREKRPIVGRH